MDNYSVKDNHDIELNEIFKKYSLNNDIVRRGLVSQDQVVRNAILFVGINPSYKYGSPFTNPTNYYNLLQAGNPYKTYFRRFEDISEKTKTYWTHIDLLYFQETNQKMVEHFLNHSEETRSFIVDQLKVTRTILENIQPKMIVISNALAGYVFGNRTRVNLGYNHEFDHQLGTHVIHDKNSNLNKTPIFFTSMLTGVRALDNGSYERLIWHINKILNTHNSK